MAVVPFLTRRDLYKAGLEVFHRTGMDRVFSDQWRGMGGILMFHRVEDLPANEFHPNRNLSVSPAFFEQVLDFIEASGLEVVSLDEVHRRLVEGYDGDRRFVALTFDDGFIDNYTTAYPVLKKRGMPFTIYVATGLIDNTLEMWWVALETIIRDQNEVVAELPGETLTFDCSTKAGKAQAYRQLGDRIATHVSEDEQRRFVERFAERYGLDLEALCAREGMTWDQVRELDADPLVTIGGHTEKHHALARLDREAMLADIQSGIDRLTEKLGHGPQHFAYPYGLPSVAGPREFDAAKAFGFKTAVTTRPGVLFPEHRDHLTALPRVSVNGEFQQIRYLEMLLAGWPFALFNRFRKLNVA
ncbi:MAG: polysaccharide deacetylase [Hyphomicrobiales bacterium]|nr:MAG: polysaccharide deacetylase [Hyphomicrobiales bacterium]